MKIPYYFNIIKVVSLLTLFGLIILKQYNFWLVALPTGSVLAVRWLELKNSSDNVKKQYLLLFVAVIVAFPALYLIFKIYP
jgi:hypothetical protein